MRHRAKRDGNHAAIVAALRAAGCSVLELHAVGGGCPDLLAGRAGWERLIEVKREGWTGPQGSKQRLTHLSQQEFSDTWRGTPVKRVTTVEDALAAMGVFAAVRP